MFNVTREMRTQFDEIYYPMESTDEDKIRLGFRKVFPRKFLKWMRPVDRTEIGKRFEDELFIPDIYHVLIFDADKYNDKYLGSRDMQHDLATNQNRAFRMAFNNWPVRLDIFTRTYGFFHVNYPVVTNDVHKYFVEAGRFLPVVKTAPLWIKIVTVPTGVHSLEHGYDTHNNPIFKSIPLNHYVVIGIDGEPYSMSPEKMEHLYDID